MGSVEGCACGGKWVCEDCSFDAHGYDGRLHVVDAHNWVCEDCGCNAADVLTAHQLEQLDEPFAPEWDE